MQKQEFSKYELARIIGARALQIAMDAPLLLKVSEEELEKMQFDPVRIAEKELDSDVLPISVRVPMPEKKEGELKKVKEKAPSKKEAEKSEEEEEKEIAEQAEIMELAKPEDEEEGEEIKTGREEID